MWRLPEAVAMVAIGERLIAMPHVDVQSILYRGVLAKHLLGAALPEPLHYLSSLSGGRFTPRHGPAGLYLSFDAATPAAEVRAIIFHPDASFEPRELDPLVTVSVRVRVSRVLDLTDARNLAPLALTSSDLRCDWQSEQERYLEGRGPMPKTQLLALVAHVSGLFAGIKFPSARTTFGTNLVVFPDRLEAPHDLLVAIDSTGKWSQRLP